MRSEIIAVRGPLEATGIARFAGANPHYIEMKTLDSGIQKWHFDLIEKETVQTDGDHLSRSTYS